MEPGSAVFISYVRSRDERAADAGQAVSGPFDRAHCKAVHDSSLHRPVSSPRARCPGRLGAREQQFCRATNGSSPRGNSSSIFGLIAGDRDFPPWRSSPKGSPQRQAGSWSPTCREYPCVWTMAVDQRIESFLTDVLALAGEDPDAIPEGVRAGGEHADAGPGGSRLPRAVPRSHRRGDTATQGNANRGAFKAGLECY
jgi:hypothetical protein